MEESKHKRQWYQYSLSTLFLLTAVVALVCGQIVSCRDSRIDAMFTLIDQWPDRHYEGEGNPCLHPLSFTTRRLRSSFSVQLSKQELGSGPDGFWIGCKRTETSDDGLTRWVGICTVQWKAGKVVRISRYDALVPAFRSGDSVFLYWDHRDTAKDTCPFYLWSTPSQYWMETSDFRMATVDLELLDTAHYRLITLAEFESLVDGTNSADGTSVDGVTLFDIERLKAGKTTFQGVIPLQ